MEETQTPQTNQFEPLGLSDACCKAVADSGYTIPTEIQAKAIPAILMRKDVIGIARTGTGKTASFTLPMIDVLAGGFAKARMPRALVLAPTRELAAQVAENFEKYGKNTRLSCALIVGGVAATDQVGALQRGVDVLIATPGRLLDLFERGNILLHDIKMLVIDEADRMLDMGFIPDIEKIIKLLPFGRQTLLFSATMPPEIERLAKKFMSMAVTVSAAPPASAAETVEQRLIVLSNAKDKYKAMKAALKAENLTNTAENTANAFVFCNRKLDVAKIGRQLVEDGFSAAPLHGDMPQNKRTEALAAFKNGATSILICSDVAARGLDISGVNYVINYDIPFNAEDYIHRIGRTGRAGKSGVAISLAVEGDDDKLVQAIEKLMAKPIPKVASPFANAQQPTETAPEQPPVQGKDTLPAPRQHAPKAAAPKPSAERKPAPFKPREDDAPIEGFGDDVPAFMRLR